MVLGETSQENAPISTPTNSRQQAIVSLRSGPRGHAAKNMVNPERFGLPIARTLTLL